MVYKIPPSGNATAIATLRKQIQKKQFRIEVSTIGKQRAWGCCPEFSRRILIPLSIVKLFSLNKGDSFLAYVDLGLNTGGNHFQFIASVPKTITPSIVRTPTYKTYAHKESVLNTAKQTATAPPPPKPKKPVKVKAAVKQKKQQTRPNQRRTRPKRKCALSKLGSMDNLKHVAQYAWQSAFPVPPNALYQIYIDEAWKQQKTGIIAGVVIISPGLPESPLPEIPTHLIHGGSPALGDLQLAKQALTAMCKAPNVFPFIFPIQLSGEEGSASQHYDLLRETSIKLLLSWLLPRSTQGEHGVEVYLERIGGYYDGHNITDQLKGFLSAFQNYDPKRFKPWKIVKAEYTGKEFGYVPYGDLLAYIAQEHQNHARHFMETMQLKKLPGYLRLTTRLSEQLNHLIPSETNIGSHILEFLYDQKNTHLCSMVLEDLKQQVKKDSQLRETFLTILQEEFQKKERNLSRLRSLTEITFELIGHASPDISPRCKLMQILIVFQQVNHHGASENIQALIHSYRQSRKHLKDEEFALVSYVDLNLAVSFADAFNYQQSLLLTQEVLSDPAFAALSLREKGRAWSAQGQYLSMSGKTVEADSSFDKALEFFERIHTSETFRQGEMLQTRIYRAINAVNGQSHNAISLVEQAVPLTQTSVGLMAADKSYRSQYQHHLLVRSLWLLDNSLMHSLRECYVEEKHRWQYFFQHPWELICLYRALFLYEISPDEASQHFDHALEICSFDKHGNTLKLIGAMIAVIAYCALNRTKYKTEAEALLASVSPAMPHAAPTISSLRSILDTPSKSSITQALAACPFNYH